MGEGNKKTSKSRQTRIIERPRLIAQMDEQNARVTLILAPAGYGKTTLLRQWVSRQDELAVISLDRSARDVAALARDLALAFAPFSPALPRRIDAFLAMGARPDLEPLEIARTLFEGLGSRIPHLVIDDYQEIAGIPEAETLIEALEKNPDASLVIASRTRPAWATTRKLVYGECAVISKDDLAMNLEEASQILRTKRSFPQAVVDQAKGWPAVLALAARSSRTETPPGLLPDALHRFFADELFDGVPPAIQRDLIHLALLPQQATTADQRNAWSSALAANSAVDLGFASLVDGRLEVHPLIRDFLLSKLTAVYRSDAIVRRAVLYALGADDHDAALDLVLRFHLADLIDPLISASFRTFASTGRVATLEEITAFASASEVTPSPLLDLVDAEVEFRNGRHGRAEPLAVGAAEKLTASRHPLAARAWWLAGTTAHLLYQDGRARNHFLSALQQVPDEVEKGEVIWGIALASLCSEDPALLPGVLDDLETRKDRSPQERVRWASGYLMKARLGSGLRDTPGLELALHAVRRSTDPHVRTGFLMLYAYHRALQSHYMEAISVTRETLNEAASYGMEFVRPHALMTLALGLIGSRKTADARHALDEAEAIDRDHDPFFVPNLQMLRARVALQEGRVQEAAEFLVEEPIDLRIAAVRSEFVALRALSLALLAEGDAAKQAQAAKRMSRGVEGRVLGSMALAVCAARSGDSSTVVQEFDSSFVLDAWDGILTALRICSELTQIISTTRPHDLGQIAQRARDHSLARTLGIRLPRSNLTTDLLSPRELEVWELLRSGLTNKEIGAALFISESTAKLHVRHIFSKLNVTSRTQAVLARFDRQPER